MIPADRTILATLRHDLRTPLNAIIGYSDILSDDAADLGLNDLIGDLAKIKAAGDELLLLVNEILDPAQHAGPELDLESLAALLRQRARTPLNAVIGYSEILLEDAAANPESSQFASDLTKINSAGRSFLERINAIVTDAHSTAGDQIDDQHSPTVGLIQEMADTLQSLAVAPTSTEQTIASQILVVDDSATNRDVLARRLERQGHTVEQAENGRVALELLGTRAFDLLLLDVMMPEMNGYEVLHQLQLDPTLSNIPVLMISALDEIDSVVRCIEMGATDYLPKPFNPVLLKARVDTCLEKKRLRDQEQEYLHNVGVIAEAAAMVEAGSFDPQRLRDVEQRTDELGRLARVFVRMAREVELREQRLKQEIHELRIEVDAAKRARNVAEITETEFFQDLQAKARKLRSRK